MPLAGTLQICVGMLIALFIARLLKLRPLEKSLFLVCAAFGNSAALPLLFSNALFEGASLATFTSCISFFLLGWTPLFWSVGYGILAAAPEVSQEGDPALGTGVGNLYGKSSEGGLVGEEKEKKKGFALDRELLKKAGGRILTPPLVGAAMGLIVGLIPQAQMVLEGSVVFDALMTVGRAYTAVAILVLAGNLAMKRNPKTRLTKETAVRWKRVTFGISFVRFIMMPLVGLGLIKGGVNIWTNPATKLAVLLEATMPSAQNSVLILTLENKPESAAQMARILFAVYLIGVLPISLSLSSFLALTGFK